MSNLIIVSVVCIAYNQEKYIRKTLEGFVNQVTNFEYEVLIHDDASTDKTPEIISEYAKKYPDLIKPIYQKKNQYSKGVSVLAKYNYPRAKGKYIAYCEGDDYWCDNYKLQKQYDQMEMHEECSICVHDVQCIDKNGTVLNQRFPKLRLEPGVISPAEYIHDELCVSNWLFQTSCYFLKREVIDYWMESFCNPYPMGDLPLVLLSLQFGKCFYINEVCSCYRKDAGGSMSKLRDNTDAAIRYYEKIINGHKIFDNMTNGQYHKDFDYAIRSTEVQIFKLKGEYKKIHNRRYKDFVRRMDWKNKVLCIVGVVFPKLSYKIFESVRKRNRNG